MESPINPAVWKYLYNTALGALAAATLYSVYRQRYDLTHTMSEAVAALDSAKNVDDQEAALHEILSRLQSDALKKQFHSRLSLARCGSTLVPLLKLSKDGSNAAVVSVALKVVQRVYGADDEGRAQFHKHGGFRVLLATLSEAYRQGNEDLMEESATALQQMTVVNDAEVILDTDVPKGAEGAHAVAKMSATVKMLRILDPEGPVLFLNALTGIFANICTLSEGAVSIGKGTDGYSGISFFLRLLDHTNRNVVENSVRAVRYMVRADVGCEEVAKEQSVARLADNLEVNGQPAVINSILTIILVMAGNRAHSVEFFTNVNTSTIPNTLFELWIRSSDSSIRNRAEVLCRLLTRVGPTSANMTALLQRFRPQIEERRNKDEQEYKRQMQQAKQNQMMQRMMMEEMGMDPSMLG